MSLGPVMDREFLRWVSFERSLMNVRTATLLSIAGVLAAGTAAVAVNTQVLSGSKGSDDMPSQLTLPVSTQVYTVPEVVDVGQPALADDISEASVAPQVALGIVSVDSTLPSTGASTTPSTAPNTTPSTAPNTTSAPANTLMAFQIGDAGVATVDTVGGVLTIVDMALSPGWKLQASSGSGTVRLAFELASSTQKVSFGAFLSGGEVITSISSEAVPSASDSGRYDDDDDDDHDDDDDDDDDDHDRGDDDD